MDQQNPKPLRCAVYTRKSNERGLELPYNSLHAQLDSATAFIKSHEALGWVQLKQHYEDGGYTGGNMNRPALQQMISDIKLGKIDIVVAYRYDRLTRSFMDFAKLLELFEKYHVAFVSVSEAIDTSSPMGKFLPGILILIAQVERENDSRRIRDKIYASKRKGLWVGGVAPIGYKVVDKQLVVDEEYAPLVRAIFKRYGQLGSPYAVAKELNDAERFHHGKRWITSNIMSIVRNPIYAGIIPIRSTGEMCKGVHQGLISIAEFRQIRRMHKMSGPRRSYGDMVVPLKGFVQCGCCGHPMIFYYGCKHGKDVRYGYYRCNYGHRRAKANCPMRPIAERVLNAVVAEELAAFMSRDRFLRLMSGGDRKRQQLMAHALKDPEKFGKSLALSELARLCELLVEDVTMYPDKVQICFRNIEGVDDGIFTARRVQRKLELRESRIYILRRDEGSLEVTFPQPPLIIKQIAKGMKWMELLTSGTYSGCEDLAKTLNASEAVVRSAIRAALLSPLIVDAIINRKAPHARYSHLVGDQWTLLWEEQLRVAGLVGPVATKVDRMISEFERQAAESPKDVDIEES